MLDACCVPNLDDSTFLVGDSLPLVTSSGLSPSYVPEPSKDLPQMRIHLIKVFYEYFHAAHPVLPPLDLWAASSPPQYLVNIIEFIGLHHLSPSQVPEISTELWAAIGNADLALEKVQAYLLLGIALHGRKAPDGAKQCIGLAIQCSLLLGLHCRELSDTMETQSPRRAESMRRTLWEILVVDTILAAVQIGGTLQFNMETPDVHLPSEDATFQDGHANFPSISAKDLGRRAVTDGSRMSSLAYRVEATLILRQCVIACETYACQETIEVLDSMISAWFHRWPRDKSTILQLNGKVDQIDFQSAMIMQCASIYLHFPKSFLISYLPDTQGIFCSRPPPIGSPSPNPQLHTAKVVNAAVEISKLASLSTCVTGHSPFFACTLVLSSIVQVTVLSAHIGHPIGKHYPYLTLNIGVLNSLGGIWNIAASSLDKIRAVTREVEAASIEPSEDLVGCPSTPPVLPT
ncbi:Transcription factor [Penicillium sp. IBT 35674x]|nr:Transcription factor [Penicillium sp. IBT 35674x]